MKCVHCGSTAHTVEAEIPHQKCFVHLMECKALLTAMEWNGSDIHHMCPNCTRMRIHGHDKDCQLAYMLY